jgi:hypothetical protein
MTRNSYIDTLLYIFAIDLFFFSSTNYCLLEVGYHIHVHIQAGIYFHIPPNILYTEHQIHKIYFEEMLDKNNIAINHNEPRQQTFLQHTKHLDIGKSNYKISGLKNTVLFPW